LLRKSKKEINLVPEKKAAVIFIRNKTRNQMTYFSDSARRPNS
jgi:hypothetical protein